MPHRHDRSTPHGNVTLRPRARARRALPPRERHLTRERVQDLVDGEIPRPDETAHLGSCPRCASELRVYQYVVALVRELARATREAPAPLTRQLGACLTNPSPPHSQE